MQGQENFYHYPLLFTQTVKFKADRATRTVPLDVLYQELGDVEGKKTQKWPDLRFLIPPLPASQLIYCNIIDIEYYVTVSIVGNRFCASLLETAHRLASQ